MNFLYHYLDLAVYPVNPTKYIKAPKENFYSDLYGRFSKVLFTKEKEKQELLLKSCTNPHLISEDRLVKIFRFLYHFTGSHIKGYVGELFALPLLKLYLSEQLDNHVIIPGGAIQINNLQGPDGLIARLSQNEENGYSLRIGGIVEIKAKKTSKSKLLKQLQNHYHRLQDTNAQISLHIAEGDVLTFISPMLYITPPTYQTIVVSEISFSEHIQYYTIVPPAKSAQKADSFITIPLFWSEEGFNRITFSFLKWVVENFGRTIDPYNYDIGVENWIENLKILKDSSLLTKAEKKLASNLLIFLEGEWQNPDDKLQTLNVQ